MDAQAMAASVLVALVVAAITGWVRSLHNKVDKMEVLLNKIVAMEQHIAEDRRQAVEDRRRILVIEDISSRSASRLAVLDRITDEFTPVLRELSTTVAKLSAVVEILRGDYLDKSH